MFTHLIGRDRADIGLRHLTDFLPQRHARHDFGYASLHRGVFCDGMDKNGPIARGLSVQAGNRGSAEQPGPDRTDKEGAEQLSLFH